MALGHSFTEDVLALPGFGRKSCSEGHCAARDANPHDKIPYDDNRPKQGADHEKADRPVGHPGPITPQIHMGRVKRRHTGRANPHGSVKKRPEHVATGCRRNNVKDDNRGDRYPGSPEKFKFAAHIKEALLAEREAQPRRNGVRTAYFHSLGYPSRKRSLHRVPELSTSENKLF